MAYTTTGNNNFNFNFVSTSTTKASFNSYGTSNLDVGGFNTTSNSMTSKTTLPLATTNSLSGLSSLNLFTAQTTPKVNTIPSILGGNTTLNSTIKPNSINTTPSVSVGQNFLSGLLENFKNGFDLVKPSASVPLDVEKNNIPTLLTDPQPENDGYI